MKPMNDSTELAFSMGKAPVFGRIAKASPAQDHRPSPAQDHRPLPVLSAGGIDPS